MDGKAASKVPPRIKMSRLCTPWLCVIGGNLRSIASEVGISSWAAQSILTNILGRSNVTARWVLRMLTDDQNRTGRYISRCLLSRYEDDMGNFLE